MPRSLFGAFVARSRAAGRLVVQPRMGFGAPQAMRDGLTAVKAARATTIGTVTLDSYTRVGDLDAARKALDEGADINGYPIVTHGTTTNRKLVEGLLGPGFPIQVRHGSARPQDIIAASLRAGLDATEGGPVSYCLPYGRISLRDSVRNWEESCALMTAARAHGAEPHVETFGGCMLGQLCPPGLLVAISLLEGVFFHRHGVRSISLSYAQQTHAGQDRGAVRALRRLARRFLPGADWHVVVYTYMGVYPRTGAGARLLLEQSVDIAVRTGAERLIVKTAAEAHRIATVEENVQALEAAAAADRRVRATGRPPADGDHLTGGFTDDFADDFADDLDAQEILDEATSVVTAVLALSEDPGTALKRAFAHGLLDVPYCLHADNMGRTRSYIAPDGRLRWSRTGSLPFGTTARTTDATDMTAADLLGALSRVQRSFDRAASLGVPPGHVQLIN
ncbi:methylaspartate mutase [Streptomyces sp. UNOC14_S4]|uniref:methylaspartate mutase n=1 Tax=Streptomyces sp. UNOC14_S4 TaxID=2872340 RepID=UPI001E30ED0A|nr:methylaspartate mutase [Streptomyces sp. UNOC14_S4]MCC3772358.1 methylaspartate mutase [Streptomyces sp. UNOC14_S4]